MAAEFGEMSVRHHYDAVGVVGGVETVRDSDDRLPLVNRQLKGRQS